MRAEQHDDTLGPCPWCSSTEHWVYDEGSAADRTERDFWAQCRECNQCSPSYPTIETLREGWAECRRGEPPKVAWIGFYKEGRADAVYFTDPGGRCIKVAVRTPPPDTDRDTPRDIVAREGKTTP